MKGAVYYIIIKLHFQFQIEVLREIVKAVNNRCEIYLDGGVQQGTDIFKALALGAKMVFIGRPVLWGLACGGMDGVRNILNILKTEFDHTLALSGNLSFALSVVLTVVLEC